MEEKVLRGTVTIINRKSIEIDGVESIDGFDEGYVALSTNLGKTIVEGENLKVVNLSKENETICVTGKIDSVFFAEQKPRSDIAKRLFR